MWLRVPSGLQTLGGRLNDIGFERTRRAAAALALSMFVTLYVLVSVNAPEGLAPALLALAACYGVAFVAVVAEWFWGRWFATGLGMSGIMVAIASLAMLGWTPVLAIYGGLHIVVVLCLMGKKMAARYDLQDAWRQRYQMDEFGVARLRKTVTRSAASLPSLIFWALGPREGAMMVAALGAMALAAVGLRGLIRLRSWGVLALGGALALAGLGGLGHVSVLFNAVSGATACPTAIASAAPPVLAFAFLASAVLPFAGPLRRFLRHQKA